jgi:hypothetical protein
LRVSLFDYQPLDDSLIAATAHIHKTVLATGNLRHYPMDDIEKIAVVCD